MSEDISFLERYLEYIDNKMNRSTIHTENGFKVYYPSSKAVKDGIEKSMA